MVRKSKGPRRKTRRSLRRRVREKATVTRFLQEFKIGSKVVIKPTVSSDKGRPYKRFFGKIGVVIDKRGKSYIIKIREGDKEKKIISRPEHLRRV
jgi:large subunit ribosomal protein L21e